MSNSFMRVDDVANELGVSKSYAYKVIQKLNVTLKEMGYMTVAGRVSKKYFMDYDVITKLKRFTDKYGVCLLLVHHTRKQQSDDKFEMISGTTGLLGAADGVWLLQKEKRTGNNATMDIIGRDQQDQRLYLIKDTGRLIWQLEKAETELWKEPPDPILDAVAALVPEASPEWIGSPTELVNILCLDIKPNSLTQRLNVSAGRLQNDYSVCYENSRNHVGRFIKLTLIIDTDNTCRKGEKQRFFSCQTASVIKFREAMRPPFSKGDEHWGIVRRQWGEAPSTP